MVFCGCCSGCCVPKRPQGKGLQFLNEVEPHASRISKDGERVWGPAYRNAMYPGPEDGWKTTATTLYELFLQSVGTYPDNKMLGYRPGNFSDANPYEYLTYNQVNERVKALAGAFSKRVARGASIGVYGTNCVEWQLTIQVTNRLALRCVPLYDTLGADKIEYMINHAEVRAIALQSDKLPNIAAALDKIKGTVQFVVYWGDVPDSTAAQQLKEAGIEVASVLELEREGAGMDVEDPPKEDDICTIMYTSGTTGVPKGVLLSHANVLAAVTGIMTKLHEEHIDLYDNSRYLSYLTLAHIFGRLSEDCMISLGGVIGYWRGNVTGLIDDAQAFRPTYMAGVPRVFDRVYTRAMGKLNASRVKRGLFARACRGKMGQLNAGKDPKKAGGLWNKLVFKKVAAVLGGNLELVVAGGAPLAPHTEDFLRLSMCSYVSVGYGLSETCSAGCMVNAREPAQAGSVGVPLPGIQVRLAAVPEMGYDPLGTPARGEVLLKGPQIFQGYHKMPDKTREVLTEDGWFMTGDVGEWTPGGALKIIDRVKNIFKLAQGEYVAVEKVEAAYKKNSFIDQVWVYGNSLESCLVAVVVPLQEVLVAWGESNGKKGASFEELCEDDDVVAHVLRSLTATAKEQLLKGFEMVKAIKLVPEPFTVENDLLTPSFKLKRHELQKRFQGTVNALYGTLKASAKKE